MVTGGAPGDVVKACTSRSASAASSGAPTVPVSSMRPFILETVMSASGMASFSIWSMLVRFVPTRIVAEYSVLPPVVVTVTAVSPGALARM